MQKKRILYVSQEICPYSPANLLSEFSKILPTEMNEEEEYEVRVFMPRYGCINERRHQLHEVIRLSGINLIVNDLDQPLIIKVASMPKAKFQVYFIDNEDYFKRKFMVTNEEGEMFGDNDERMLFFCKGVLETVKKLGWSPDIIHCSGWMSALVPLYLKKCYADDPVFSDVLTVYSDFSNYFQGTLDNKIKDKLQFDNIDSCALDGLESPDFYTLQKLAIEHADIVTFCTTSLEAVKESSRKVVHYEMDDATPDTWKELFLDIYRNGVVKTVEG